MKIIALFSFFFTSNAFAEFFFCSTRELGEGYRLEVETHYNQPVARYKVIKWSSAPPPAFGEKVILESRGNIKIVQKIPRPRTAGMQEDYTKWSITSPDVSINIIHYGVSHEFSRIGTMGGGLPGTFTLIKRNIKGNISCERKR